MCLNIFYIVHNPVYERRVIRILRSKLIYRCFCVVTGKFRVIERLTLGKLYRYSRNFADTVDNL